MSASCFHIPHCTSAMHSRSAPLDSRDVSVASMEGSL
jgi:hypothetical protein